MPRAVEVHLAGKVFSRNEAMNFFSNMLNISHRIPESDYPIVLDLFKKYLPLYDILNVEIALNTTIGRPNYAFLVTYIDDNGEEVRDFKSYVNAVKGINRKKNINKQLRFAVSSHTMAYKRRHYRKNELNVCTCCHKELTDNEVQVDHYPVPFCHIVRDFMHSRNISYDNITQNKDGKNIPEKTLNDFKVYHNERAQYRLVCQECNVRSFHDPDYKKHKEEIYIDSDGDEII